jgi:hypothetical protein
LFGSTLGCIVTLVSHTRGGADILRATLATNGIQHPLCVVLTPIGSGLISRMATVVLVFAALQYRGVRRLTHPVTA